LDAARNVRQGPLAGIKSGTSNSGFFRYAVVLAHNGQRLLCRD
jgi:hypothetical protein